MCIPHNKIDMLNNIKFTSEIESKKKYILDLTINLTDNQHEFDKHTHFIKN